MGLLFHTSCVVKDINRAALFYDKLLGTIGAKRKVDQLPLAIGYGREAEHASFWLQSPEHFPFLRIAYNCHFAFKVETEKEVMSFHDCAISLGAKKVFDSRDNERMTNYIGFVFEDFDGHLPEIFSLR